MIRIRYQNQMHVLASKHINTLQQLKTAIRTIFTKSPKQFDLYYQVDKHLLKLSNDKNNRLNTKEIEDILQNKTRLQIIPTNSQNNLIREAIQFDEDLIKSLESSLVLQNKIQQQRFKKIQSSVLKPEELQVQLQKEEQIDLKDFCQNQSQNQNFSSYIKDGKEYYYLNQKNSEYNAQCDNCFCFPIKNVRYKCSICEDFDLCLQCQSKVFHSHPLLKIKSPKQIITSIKITFDQSLIEVMKQKQDLLELVLQNQKYEEKKLSQRQKVGKYVQESERKEVNIQGNNFLGCALGMKTEKRKRQQKNNFYERNCQSNLCDVPSFY